MTPGNLPWVPTFPPTNPPKNHWYESKIGLLSSLLQDSRCETTKLENENEELEEEVQHLRGHVITLKRANTALKEEARERRDEARVARAKMRKMREVRREEGFEEASGRMGRLREVGAERRVRRLERENRLLRGKIDTLEKRANGLEAGDDDDVEDGGDEKMEIGREVEKRVPLAKVLVELQRRWVV